MPCIRIFEEIRRRLLGDLVEIGSSTTMPFDLDRLGLAARGRVGRAVKTASSSSNPLSPSAFALL